MHVRNPLRALLNRNAAGNSFAASTEPTPAPSAADLAATEDIQFTQRIKDLATSLDHNPVKIYNWVRNNIQFIPTYGSIQGADMTLQNKKGNAFDTASLLIALYRVSGIHARYAYGLIQLPANQVNNWVGGVNKPEAAQQLLGQGGVPNIGIVQQGQIKSIKLEHVWVEAWVDYNPSRGAVHKEGDTWVQVDASFKQYQFTQGMQLKDKVPFNATSFLDQMKQGATINEAEGWVQGINTSTLQSQLTTYQQQVQAYITSQNPNATVGDVLGSQKIIETKAGILPGGLPYAVPLFGSRFATIPATFRHQYSQQLYDNQGRALINYSASLPSLAGKKITLSFVPATQLDEQVITNLLPKPHADGSPIQPSELPQSLPGYLIKLRAQLRIDGQLVAESHPAPDPQTEELPQTPYLQMGDDTTMRQGLFSPDQGWEYASESYPTAGEVFATALDLQGIAQSQLEDLKTRMTQTKTKLEAKDFSNLTGDAITGDLLYAPMLAYFAVNDSVSQLSARSADMVSYRRPSFGNFYLTSSVRWFFGFAQSVRFPGVTMDVGFARDMVSDKNNDLPTIVAYNSAQSARYSAYEHIVPEQMFNTDPNNKIEAISAVKALSIATTQGQRIYTITAATINAALPQLTVSDSVKDDIRNAVAAGKVVTISQNKITLNGWTGVGYVVADPETGGAAYKISGGRMGPYC